MTTEAPIRFLTAAEFQSRPAWLDGIDPSKHHLKKIIGDYSFSGVEALPCGLRNCRTRHQNGYVVETDDGLETHIGNRCGERYFGVNWGDIQSVYNRAAEDRDRQDFLDSTLRQRDESIARIDSLTTQLTETNNAVREVLERLNHEPAMVTAIGRLIRSGGAIQVEREIDIETARAMNLPERQRTYMQTAGRVAGIGIITAGSTLGTRGASYQLRLQAALTTLNDLSASSLRGLNSRQRKDRAKAVEQVQETASEAESYIESTKQFLVPSNLRELSKLPLVRPNSRTQRILRHFAQLGDGVS